MAKFQIHIAMFSLHLKTFAHIGVVIKEHSVNRESINGEYQGPLEVPFETTYPTWMWVDAI